MTSQQYFGKIVPSLSFIFSYEKRSKWKRCSLRLLSRSHLLSFGTKQLRLLWGSSYKWWASWGTEQVLLTQIVTFSAWERIDSPSRIQELVNKRDDLFLTELFDLFLIKCPHSRADTRCPPTFLPLTCLCTHAKFKKECKVFLSSNFSTFTALKTFLVSLLWVNAAPSWNIDF